MLALAPPWMMPTFTVPGPHSGWTTPCGTEPRRVLLDRRDDSGHGIDRIVFRYGPGTVTGPTVGVALPADHAPVGDHHVQAGRFGGHSGVGFARHDLHRGASLHDCISRFAPLNPYSSLIVQLTMTVGRGPWSVLGQPRHGRQDGRHAALGVARAAAIKPPLALLRLKRLDGHPVDRHRVLMGIQQDHAAVLRGTVTVQPGDEIVVARRHGLPMGRQT